MDKAWEKQASPRPQNLHVAPSGKPWFCLPLIPEYRKKEVIFLITI
jgi:hypothetical protein